MECISQFIFKYFPRFLLYSVLDIKGVQQSYLAIIKPLKKSSTVVCRHCVIISDIKARFSSSDHQCLTPSFSFSLGDLDETLSLSNLPPGEMIASIFISK